MKLWAIVWPRMTQSDQGIAVRAGRAVHWLGYLFGVIFVIGGFTVQNGDIVVTGIGLAAVARALRYVLAGE